jgi:hypothetical protein
VFLAKEQSLPILNVLCLTQLVRAGLELTTYRLLSESTTTRLRQPVKLYVIKLILTNCIQFIVTWDSLRVFIICFTDYKRKLRGYVKGTLREILVVDYSVRMFNLFIAIHNKGLWHRFTKAS